MDNKKRREQINPPFMFLYATIINECKNVFCFFVKYNYFYQMIVSEEEKKERLDKCSLCPNYRKDFTYLWIFKVKDKPQCNICKCHIPTKVIFTDSECPIKKW